MNAEFFSGLEKTLDRTVAAFRRDLGKVRTGRASAAILEGVVVDYYGSQTPLNQLANISVPEPRLLTIQAYDQNAISNIERSILKADLGLTPSNDGKLIRVPIPELSEERRRDLVKQVRKTAEEFRVSVRNHRRTAIEELKSAQKSKGITEDDLKQSQERVGKITNEFITKIDALLKSKEDEIMEV